MRLTQTLSGVRQLDWLGLFAASTVAPLAYDTWRPLTYASSLLFWLIPTFLLWPRFASLTDSGGRRREAFTLSVVQTVVLGIALDFVLGRWVLNFDQREPTPYLAWVRVTWLHAHIPVEELLFYLLGPVAILLVYVWCDEYWMSAYNPVERRLDRARQHGSIVQLSWRPLAVGLLLEIVGVIVHDHFYGSIQIPIYYTFLVVGAIVPATLLFECVSSLVNWRAFGVTLLYVVLTSVIWESTLALPRAWWWYQRGAMMGIWLAPFTQSSCRQLPLEAALVWIGAPFSVVLTYEAVKAELYRRRPTKPVFRPT